MGRPKKQVNKGGRPTVITPEVLAKLEQAFAIDSTVQEALAYAEIKQDAYYDYLKKTPEFSERIEELRQRPILAARKRVVNGINETYQNAIDYLKRKRREEFGDRMGVDAQVKITVDPEEKAIIEKAFDAVI